MKTFPTRHALIRIVRSYHAAVTTLCLAILAGVCLSAGQLAPVPRAATDPWTNASTRMPLGTTKARRRGTMRLATT